MNFDKKSKTIAGQALGLLLGGRFNQDDWSQLDWNLFISIARKNLILIRTFDALEKRGVSFPRYFSKEVQEEKKRVQAVTELVKRTSHLYLKNNIPFLLPTVLQHYPDMGGDIDILVADPSKKIDRLLEKEFQTRSHSKGLLNLLSTESSFTLEQPSPSIEVHHGRIGLTGEHCFYPTLIFKNRKTASMEEIEIPIPSPEDHLLLQTIQRMYCRFYFRISDIVHPITILRGKTFDWDYVIKTSSAIGISDGLGSYLSLLDRVYHDIFGYSLVPESIKTNVRSDGRLRLSFRKSYYRYPMLPVTGRIYWNKILDDILAGRFASVARLCLLPAVALTSLARNLLGRRSRYFTGTENRAMAS